MKDKSRHFISQTLKESMVKKHCSAKLSEIWAKWHCDAYAHCWPFFLCCCCYKPVKVLKERLLAYI